MPRKPLKDKWTSQKFAFGFCFEKNGKVYTNIYNVRKITDLVWHVSNKQAGIEVLESRIIDYLNAPQENIEKNNITTWYQLIELYSKSKINASREVKRKINNAIQSLLPNDFFLTDINGMREEIGKNINYLLQIKSEPKKGEKKELKHRPTTINRNLEFIRQIFNFALEEGYLTKQIIRKELFLNDDSDIERQEFTDNELLQILEYSKLKNYEHYLLIKFIAITGARIQEVLNLKWSDINQDRIKILGKGKKLRDFPLKPFPELQKLLDEQRKFDFSDNKVFRWKNRTNPAYFLNKVCKRLEIDCQYRSFHSIRKYIENYMVDNNISPFVAAQLIGHTPETQSKHYAATKKLAELNEHIINKFKGSIGEV